MLVLRSKLARIVIDEADRAQAQLGVAHEFADHQATAIAATDDEDVAGALGDAQRADTTLGEHVHEEPGAAEQRELEQEEQGDHARRQRHRRGHRPDGVVPDDQLGRRLHRVQQCDRADDDHRGDDHRLDHRFEVPLADVGPQSLVHAEGGEDDEDDGNDPRQGRRQQVLIPRRDRVIEPQLKREVIGEGTNPPSTSSWSTEWRWMGKAADLIRRRMQRAILMRLLRRRLSRALRAR